MAVATDAKLDAVLDDPAYEWLWTPQVVIVDEGHVAGDSTRYTRLLSRFGVDGRSWERPWSGCPQPRSRVARWMGLNVSRAALAIAPTAFETDPYGQLAERGVLARIQHEVLPGITVKLSAAERDDALNKRLVRCSRPRPDRPGSGSMAILVNHIQELVWRATRPARARVYPSVLSAQVLARTLRYRKIRAASVSGQTGRQ